MSCNKLYFSMLLLYVINLMSAATVTMRIFQPRETSSCEARQTPGPICESCELLATCVQHSNGWVNIPVESCDVANGYYCNVRLGTCSNATGPCHPFGIVGNFQCTSQGIFPDPYDCQKYHMCYFVGATLVAAAVDCGNDKAFDAHTGQCSMTLESRVCTQPQYHCPRVGYVAAWPSNPNIFYVCKSTVNQNLNDSVVIYPSLHRCNDGEIFADFVCRQGNPSHPDPSNPSNPDQPEIVDPNDDGFSVMPGKCAHVGLMADTHDCHKYYYCSALNGTMRHLECPAGTYYRKEQSACVLGSC
ncbi:uncharacterized protein LOC6582149 [Drosophila mojavensis]|uniref:Chitin-binding type-2 domain-containing protein n=1 Tax=Drosophila mojavensis TaxID=7230 RepID=B4KV22_DROMO|nr:uncharacterized protein LOC6582149 [Drosophila mojavensis]EDW18333.1 uncharacterized protein Dmoj_GI12142 [Drosophila mojavensis]